jgi:hypothetical protein
MHPNNFRSCVLKRLVIWVVRMQVPSRAARKTVLLQQVPERRWHFNSNKQYITPHDDYFFDGLRAGDVGELLPRDAVKAADLATNEFLPSH